MYGVCKICGCTDNNACQHPDHGSCFWVDDYHELCSHCYIDEIRNDPATEHPKRKAFRELPVLFSTPMVQAILENRKKMTRRTYRLEKVNEAPDTWELEKISQVKGDDRSYLMAEFKGVLGDGDWITAFAQYNIGDCIWVRETFFDARKFKSASLFVDGPDFYYKADKDVFIGDHKWKPSLFMPKEATRIWLECTGVRCERLQNISHEDAIAEGILSKVHELGFDTLYYIYFDQNENWWSKNPVESFSTLWESINGENSWKLNPWVFVYEFKRIEKS